MMCARMLLSSCITTPVTISWLLYGYNQPVEVNCFTHFLQSVVMSLIHTKSSADVPVQENMTLQMRTCEAHLSTGFTQH